MKILGALFFLLFVFQLVVFLVTARTTGQLLKQLSRHKKLVVPWDGLDGPALRLVEALNFL